MKNKNGILNDNNGRYKLADNTPLMLSEYIKDFRIKVQGVCKAIDSKLVNNKTYIRLSDDNLKAFNKCFSASVVRKKDGITRVRVGFNTYKLKLGDKAKGGYYRLKVIDGKNYILLTYLVEELAKCSVVWQEELKEICVVKGEYLGEGLVKGKEDLGANYLTNIYGEQLYTVRRGWMKNEVTPVYVRKKIFTKKDEFCIKESRGVLIDYIPLGKDALIMPKNSWKEEHLSLTTIEKIHDIMDVTSLVPILPISIGSDLTNAAVYAVEKKYAQMWLYLGFATVSVVTAGLASSAKFSKKVGIALTKKEGAKNLPKSAKKMTVKEYEKKYGKACVEVTSYEKINVASKETKAVEKEVKKLTLKDLKKPLADRGVTDYKLRILEEKGVKFTRNKVLEVFTKTRSGMIFWLEKGSKSGGGMEHILYKHGLELKNLGINEEEIINVIGNLLNSKPMYMLIDSRGPNMIYKFGEKYLLLAHGTNGFIVSFYSLKTAGDLKRMLDKAIQLIKVN